MTDSNQSSTPTALNAEQVAKELVTVLGFNDDYVQFGEKVGLVASQIEAYADHRTAALVECLHKLSTWQLTDPQERAALQQIVREALKGDSVAMKETK
jgi:hypothetical protein